MRHHTALGAAVLTGALLVTGYPVLVSNAAPQNPSGAALERLATDATADLRLTRDADGTVSFVGVTGGEVTNPSVSGSTSVRGAAEAHLARYGPALGEDVTVRFARRHTTASRQDVVRF